MIIGYDASRISVAHRTGTENYSFLILKHMLAQASQDSFWLYAKQPLDNELVGSAHCHLKIINWPRFWTQAGLALDILKRQPDVLFIPAHTMPVIHRQSLRTVVTIHDLGAEYLPQYHQFPQKLYLNRATEYAAHHATHLIAVSQFTKQDLINKMNVSPERISVIYEGVDLDFNKRPDDYQINQMKIRLKLPRPYLLFIGTIQPRKNLVRLIEAFAQLNNRDLDLVLAGNKGWLSDDIYQSPARLGVVDQVKFLGYIDENDKPALYAGAQATVLVSLFEGFGLPILESMACGTPVVASTSSSLPEVVGEAGELVDPLNVDSITRGLDTIVHNSKLRQQFITAGFKQAQKFNWDNAAQQTLHLLHRIGENK